MKTVAVIPARIGSKRIPKKNIKFFLGKPMIAYSIEAAKDSGVFDKVIVSTDSEEIAVVAREYGAEVPFMRPSELANDSANIDDVILHAMEWINTNWWQIDYICNIFSAAPFVRAEYVRKGFEIIEKGKATSAIAVTSFPYPIFRAFKVDEKGKLQMFWPEHRLTHSQNLPEAYHDAGQFHWADARKYAVERKLFSSDALPIILPRKIVQDIDTLEDWERAEVMYRALFEK